MNKRKLLNSYFSVMPSAHGPIFYCREKIGVKISTCARTFPLENLSEIRNRSMCADLSPMKNQSDIIQKRDIACHCKKMWLVEKPQTLVSYMYSKSVKPLKYAMITIFLFNFHKLLQFLYTF